jgi:cobyrinic acid a,c-diamide synthase
MSRVPRVAVGTIQPEAESAPILWGLMEALRQTGAQVQSFLSRACFPRYQAAVAVTGMAPRHLDSWLMSPDLCRELFLQGTQAADMAVVEGTFDTAIGTEDAGGRLEPLCRWLNLPRLAVLDAAGIDHCGLPDPPEQIDGVLLDRVVDERHLAKLATDLEVLWGVPVVGALERLARLRRRIETVPRGDPPPRRLCRELGDRFARYWQPDRIWELARAREFPGCPAARGSVARAASELTIAIAYDEAFNCYFPATLDLLELSGASMMDFSPLHDEHLPPGTDIVYFGCGHPERRAATLSENHCMKAALRSHLAAGGRIYGEGSGAAYLCHQMETPEGEMKRMVGILPAAARLKAVPSPPTPEEVTLSRPTWLGKPGARLRGYRNPNWDLEPLGDVVSFAEEEKHHLDLIGSFRAVGSLLHLNFAVQSELLRHFFHPEVPEPDSHDPWAVVP